MNPYDVGQQAKQQLGNAETKTLDKNHNYMCLPVSKPEAQLSTEEKSYNKAVAIADKAQEVASATRHLAATRENVKDGADEVKRLEEALAEAKADQARYIEAEKQAALAAARQIQEFNALTGVSL